ncbi:MULTISPECIES: DNA-binding domain-containing protein [Lactobacillaceae]|uniref:DNA-binding domain-containing protein n=2 Tax=Lactobacillales TaxID=186826 RepID=UPI001CDAEEDF|nr:MULTISPECIES: DNA-binding domain-containing protein [Lactobacillaceae]
MRDDLFIIRSLKSCLRNQLTSKNEISIEYANSLYGYKNVRSEMRYLTGDRLTGGKVSLKKFFDGLLQECNESIF